MEDRREDLRNSGRDGVQSIYFRRELKLVIEQGAFAPSTRKDKPKSSDLLWLDGIGTVLSGAVIETQGSFEPRKNNLLGGLFSSYLRVDRDRHSKACSVSEYKIWAGSEFTSALNREVLKTSYTSAVVNWNSALRKNQGDPEPSLFALTLVEAANACLIRKDKTRIRHAGLVLAWMRLLQYLKLDRADPKRDLRIEDAVILTARYAKRCLLEVDDPLGAGGKPTSAIAQGLEQKPFEILPIQQRAVATAPLVPGTPAQPTLLPVETIPDLAPYLLDPYFFKGLVEMAGGVSAAPEIVPPV